MKKISDIYLLDKKKSDVVDVGVFCLCQSIIAYRTNKPNHTKLKQGKKKKGREEKEIYTELKKLGNVYTSYLLPPKKSQ